MSWTDVFTTHARPVTLQASFGAPSREAIKAQQQTVASTFKGFGPNGWGRVRGLAFAEKHGMVPSGVTDAARGGSSPLDIGNAVHTAWQQQLNGAGGVVEGGALRAGQQAAASGGQLAAASGGQLVNDAVEYGAMAARTSDNPVYGGLIGQMMQGRGFAPFVDPAAPVAATQRVAETLTAASKAAPEVAAETAPEVVAAASGQAGAAATSTVAEAPELRNFVDNALSYLGTASNRSGVLHNTVETMAANGHLDGVDAILAREIALAPAEHSAPALLAALEHAAAPVVAAAEAAHAAPEAMKAAAEVVTHDLHPEALAAFRDSLAGSLKLMRRI